MEVSSPGRDPSVRMPSRAGRYLSSPVDNAVSLVTSASDGGQNVMTVSFFAESSHIPVLARIAIAPACLTHEYVSGTGWFGLSVLASHQWRWAADCGQLSGRETDKFRRLGLRRRETARGVPLLPGCLTTSLCRVIETVPLPDHTLFVGEIVESYRQSRLAYARPLLVSRLVELLAD